jgi:hypothetical protein
VLFNTTVELDFLSITQALNDLSKGIGITDLEADTSAIYRTCISMREEFPCKHGIENASVFKKSAVFVLEFLNQSPLEKDSFAESNLSPELKSKDPNTIMALYIAFLNITGARIFRSDGQVITVTEPIFLSRHSFLDILDMLHERTFHFMTLSLILEQITYKTNSHVQYPHKGITIGKPHDTNNESQTLYLTQVEQEESEVRFTIDNADTNQVKSLSQDEVLQQFDDLDTAPQYDQSGFTSSPNY